MELAAIEIGTLESGRGGLCNKNLKHMALAYGPSGRWALEALSEDSEEKLEGPSGELMRA